MDVWFRKYGFSRNPFSIKPAAFSYDLFGSSINAVISSIDEGKVIFVEAPLGYGKTTLLKSIIHRYGGRRKVVYAHALPSAKLDVKGLLKRSSFANIITGSLPTGMILVVDESQNIRNDSVSEITEFYGSGNIRSVVFFGTKYETGAFSGSLSINGNVLRLPKLTPEQAISMVRGRIGNLPLLSNDDILSAYRQAQGSPRRILQICEDMCRASSNGVTTSELISQPSEEVSVKASSKKGVKKKRKVAKKLQADAQIVPSAAQLSSVSSTPLAQPLDTAEERPVIKLRLKRPEAKHVRKQARKKARKAYAVRPAGKSKSGISKTVNAPDSDEGIYWGEFMGMQK